jgi:hypothetical protein
MGCLVAQLNRSTTRGIKHWMVAETALLRLGLGKGRPSQRPPASWQTNMWLMLPCACESAPYFYHSRVGRREYAHPHAVHASAQSTGVRSILLASFSLRVQPEDYRSDYTDVQSRTRANTGIVAHTSKYRYRSTIAHTSKYMYKGTVAHTSKCQYNHTQKKVHVQKYSRAHEQVHVQKYSRAHE